MFHSHHTLWQFLVHVKDEVPVVAWDVVHVIYPIP